jgi:hypothetical protein
VHFRSGTRLPRIGWHLPGRQIGWHLPGTFLVDDARDDRGIVGAGIARSAQEVYWPAVRDVALSWIVTLPAAATVARPAGLVLNR